MLLWNKFLEFAPQHLQISWSIIARKQKLTKRFQEQENRITIVELIWDPQLISTTNIIIHLLPADKFYHEGCKYNPCTTYFCLPGEAELLICSFTVHSPSVALWYFPASLSASVASSLCLHSTQCAVPSLTISIISLLNNITPLYCPQYCCRSASAAAAAAFSLPLQYPRPMYLH